MGGTRIRIQGLRITDGYGYGYGYSMGMVYGIVYGLLGYWSSLWVVTLYK